MRTSHGENKKEKEEAERERERSGLQILNSLLIHPFLHILCCSRYLLLYSLQWSSMLMATCWVSTIATFINDDGINLRGRESTPYLSNICSDKRTRRYHMYLNSPVHIYSHLSRWPGFPWMPFSSCDVSKGNSGSTPCLPAIPDARSFVLYAKVEEECRSSWSSTRGSYPVFRKMKGRKRLTPSDGSTAAHAFW